MTLLSLLLCVKIGVTLLGVAGPFLVLPAERINAIMAPHSGSTLIFRLYGVALMALLTAYTGGILAAEAGRFPTEIVAMGLVSNFGAGLTQAWFKPKGLQFALMVFFLTIAGGLLVALFNQELALSRLW